MSHTTRDSDLTQIAVNANNIPDDMVDCGIKGLGWCRGPGCQKYARLRTFVLVLVASGLLQGACETYFRISAKQAAIQFEYNPFLVDWLLVSSGLFQAIFALAFAYWAEVFHPIKWLVGTLMLQSATCVIAVIPSIINFAEGAKPKDSLVDANLCHTSMAQMQKLTLTEQQSSTLTLAMLFVLQLALGMGSLAYYTVGVTYIDDNSLSEDSPAVIGATLAGRVFGQQFGSFLALGVGLTHVGWWLGWVILAPFIFVGAVLLGLFPKRLPKTVIHQAAQRIIEQSNLREFGSRFSTYLDDTDFWPSWKRLFNNKLLMFNLISIMFLQSAVLNYGLQEESYLQSRFFLPYDEQDGLLQEWKSAFVSYFLKPPVMAVGMLIGGLIISKARLSGRTIAGINIFLALKLVAIYVGYVFINCDVGAMAGIEGGKLKQPFCSSQCLCAPTAFIPVCPENSTVSYFSPCYAGCTSQTSINSFALYEGCSCRGDQGIVEGNSGRATAGACSSERCQSMIIIYQVLSVSAAFIVGVGVIGKTLITLRSVLPQDKSLALGFELVLLGFFAYIPTHLSYELITRITCVYWAPNYERCLLRETPKHGNILDSLTAGLIVLSLLFDVLVFIYAKGLNLYNCKVTDTNYTPSLYAPVPSEPNHSTLVATGHRGGSPLLTTTHISPVTDSPKQYIKQPIEEDAPHGDITVFRNPSSLTTSSDGNQSVVQPGDSGVTYAQVVFPPDKRKPDDGSTSPKRLAVTADVPLHHLSESDVRAQLGSLKSFAAPPKPQRTSEVRANTDLVDREPQRTHSPIETNLDEVQDRPQSPETDF